MEKGKKHGGAAPPKADARERRPQPKQRSSDPAKPEGPKRDAGGLALPDPDAITGVPTDGT